MKLTVKLPNFSMTRGQIPDVAGANNAGRLRFRRRLRSVLLWSVLGLFFFVAFAWLSLPTRALAWRIEHEAKKAGFVIAIEDISIRPWGTVILRNVSWTFEPSRPGEIPGKFFVPNVDVSVSLLSLIAGTVSVDMEAKLDEGVVRAEYEKGGTESRYSFEIEDVPLYGLPKAAQSLNAPLRGIFAAKGELTLPEHQFKQSAGFVELTCAGCVIGDGESKLFVPGSTGALGNGVTIPEVDLGTLTGRMTIDKGVAKTDGPIETESDDVWVQIEGEVELADPFGRSRFDMLLKFNLSEALQDRSEPMKLMIQTASDKSKLDAPEQGLGFNLRGPVSAPRFYGYKTKSRRQSRTEKRDSYKQRAEERRLRKSKAATKSSASDSNQDSGRGGDDDEGGLDVKPIEPARPALPPIEDPPESPSVEEPVPEQPVVEEPVVEEPVVEEPVVEEPVAEEPVVEEPVAEEPVAEEPVADDPVIIEEGGDEGAAEAPAEGGGQPEEQPQE